MKEQINELLEERQSLIQSLMNLHSAEVDDVIHTRSRSCSTVSMDSVGSAFRSEFGELRERMAEAEEAEVKLTDELVNCRGLLKEALEDKVIYLDFLLFYYYDICSIHYTNYLHVTQLSNFLNSLLENLTLKIEFSWFGSVETYCYFYS